MLDIIRAAVRKALFHDESERDERWVKAKTKVEWNGCHIFYSPFFKMGYS